jgi:Raf kinase inhibitor-like YbhB/YbcL family protein
MPLANSGYGQSISPAVSWSKGPSGTKSYAVFLEDASAGQYRKPELHWLAFNIPVSVKSLPEGLQNPPAGMLLGATYVSLGANKPAGDGAPGGGPGGAPGGGLGGPPGGGMGKASTKGDPVYVGPHVPTNIQFRFALEVFALDTELSLTTGAGREDVWDAMNGHVLAKGEADGSFQAPGEKAQPEMQGILTGPSADCAQLAAPVITFDRTQTKTTGKLAVSSSTFGAEGRIPLINTGYGKSISPAASWSSGPPGTQSYVLFMEDATAGQHRKAITHWLAFNIPLQVTSLEEGLPNPPAGMVVGTQYHGPSAPSGGPLFHYTIQIYALDTTLNLTTGASREAVWEAMNGHVLAKGKVVGAFRGPAGQTLNHPH